MKERSALYRFLETLLLVIKICTGFIKLECLAKEIYKFLHCLLPPVMNNIFKARQNDSSLRNFPSLYSTSK